MHPPERAGAGRGPLGWAMDHQPMDHPHKATKPCLMVGWGKQGGGGIPAGFPKAVKSRDRHRSSQVWETL